MDAMSAGLKVGDGAPDFSVQDSAGVLRTLGDLTASEPRVFVFYRGHW
jgi:peroxiredoxin